MILDFRQLDALAAVLRLGSFELAAEELSVTSSALSQRIRQLEERLGAVLVVRGVPCKGTPEGNLVYRHAQEMALREQDLLRQMVDGAANRPIPVAIALNADTLATWFLPAMDGVEGVLLHLSVDDQDHGAGMLGRGEALAAVTLDARQVAGCDTFDLGFLRYLPVARPDFVARYFADGLGPEALGAAPTLTYDDKDRLQASWIAMVTGERIVPPTHMMATSQGLCDAALAGLGWVMLPHPMARPHIASGALTLISDDPAHRIDTPLTWQVSRAAGKLLQPLTKAVRQAAKSALIQPH